jgi:hypothetical protein
LHSALWPWFDALLRRYPVRDDLAGRWVLAAGALVLLPFVLAVAGLVASRCTPRPAGRLMRGIASRKLFFAAIALAILFCRFPLLLGGLYNMDEAEFTAAAEKLLVDPLYFRAVDNNTSGPLNIYPLLLPAAAGFSLDYTSSRLVGLAAIFFALYFLFRGFRLLASEETARLAVLFAFGFFATAGYPDFTHYSSEHISLLLQALALFAAMRVLKDPSRCSLALASLGALVSAGFFAKMQSVPSLLAATLAAFYCAVAHAKPRTSWRPVAALAAGAAPLPALVLSAVLISSLGHEAWMAYIRGNWAYGRARAGWLHDVPTLGPALLRTHEFEYLVLAMLALLAAASWHRFRPDPRQPLRRYLEYCVLAAGLLAAARHVSPPRGTEWTSYWGSLVLLLMALGTFWAIAVPFTGDSPTRRAGAMLGLMILAAFYSAYAPRIVAEHYLLLTVLPLSALMGLLLVAQSPGPWPSWRQPPHFAAGRETFLAFWLAVACAYLAYSAHATYGALWSPRKTVSSAEGEYLRRYVTPGGNLAVWGWRPDLYLETGTAMATRDVNLARDFDYTFPPAPDIADFYNHRFVRDLERRPAGYFVDALDISCCYFNDRATRSWELLPPVRDYILAHYDFLEERLKMRIWRRRPAADAPTAPVSLPSSPRTSPR